MTLTRRLTAALASSRGLFVTALLTGAICCLGLIGAGSAGGHTVTARFSDANGLVVGNEVRIAGVIAGTVTSVQMGLDASGTQYAEVNMDIDADHWPLHQGTALAVKPKGVLSNVYVDVSPGSMSNPSLGDHPFFAVSQTNSPVNLDELNNVFTPSVLDAIRTQLQEGVIALGATAPGETGAGDLNLTLANANPLTLDAIPVTDVLATRSPQLDNLNFEFSTITAELAREDANLRPLIANVNITLGALVAREMQLQGTLVHAANVLGDLSQALSSSTTQADLAHIFQASPQALTCATAVSTYLTPVVTAVNPYISYNAPLSLANVLGDFVTATGFNTTVSGGNPITSHDALRVETIVVPPTLQTTHDSGGLTLEHGGYLNASTSGGANNVYAEQLPLTGHPTLNGCLPPAGLP